MPLSLLSRTRAAARPGPDEDTDRLEAPVKEFVEFFGGQSPYDRLDADDLARLAATVDVEFFSAGEWVIAEYEQALDRLFVVRTGSVEVVDRGRVVDVLGVGDTFGHISVLSGLPPALAVRAVEDTLCYSMPDPRRTVHEPERLQFSHFNTLVARERLIAAGGPSSRLERPVTESMRPVLWCGPEDTVRDAAQRLTEERRDAALVRYGTGYGIVTDHDFRAKVATGAVGLDAPVSEIASRPALSVTSDATAWAAYLSMVDHGVHHMVVTTAAGDPAGVTGVMDLVGADVHHPLVVRSAIAAARTLDQLAEACELMTPTMVELWDADVSSAQLGAVRAAMVESVVRKVLELEPVHPSLGGTPHSWLVLGSVARREPLPASDVDTALVWQDRDGAPGPGAPAVRDAATATLEHLVRCGLRLCPHDANASHPAFGRPVEHWIGAVDRWIGQPWESTHLVLASALLDARPLTRPRLGQVVQGKLLAGSRHDEFVQAMLRFALTDRPPAGFVKGYVVERWGERRGRLDVKRAGLRPVVSLARALALRAGDVSGTTPERLSRAAQEGLLSAEEADTLEGAFTLFHGLLVDEEIEALRNGRPAATHLSPAALDPLRRRHLREGFRAVERIQERIRSDRRLGLA